MNNLDKDTVKSFSDQWLRYDQSGMSKREATKLFKNYFPFFHGINYKISRRF